MQDIQELSRRLRTAQLTESMKAFAKRSKVSRRTLHRILAGWNNPTLATMQKLEKALFKEKS